VKVSMKDFKEQVKEASFELKKKSYREIQEETAWKWSARAAASYQNVINLSGASDKLDVFLLAQEYEHESIEHAALISDPEVNLVKEVQEAIEQYRLDAWNELQLTLLA
jgi:hypothetical protein